MDPKRGQKIKTQPSLIREVGTRGQRRAIDLQQTENQSTYPNKKPSHVLKLLDFISKMTHGCNEPQVYHYRNFLVPLLSLWPMRRETSSRT